MPTNADGLIQSVKFDVNGKPPQDQVTLGDVAADQVRGLVITASPDKGERIMRKGEITLQVPDLSMSVPLDVNMRLPDQGHYLLWVGLGGAAVVGLLLLLALAQAGGTSRRRRWPPRPGTRTARRACWAGGRPRAAPVERAARRPPRRRRGAGRGDGAAAGRAGGVGGVAVVVDRDARMRNTVPAPPACPLQRVEASDTNMAVPFPVGKPTRPPRTPHPDGRGGSPRRGQPPPEPV